MRVCEQTMLATSAGDVSLAPSLIVQELVGLFESGQSAYRSARLSQSEQAAQQRKLSDVSPH